jgi:Family of unknown function (DUF6134)
MNLIRAFFASIVIWLAPVTALAEPTPAPAKLWAPKAGDVIRFNVLRDGKAFGSHAVRFEVSEDGTLVAKTDVSLKAGVGPVTLFRYQLTATEKWTGGKLIEMTGRVNDDGKKRSVSARQGSKGLNVSGTDFKGVAPTGVIPASHWNYAQTRSSQLLSTEDGEILDVKVSSLGREKIKAGASTIDANHYRMDAVIDVDLWYDDSGRWVKLSFEARGQTIEYVLDRMY